MKGFKKFLKMQEMVGADAIVKNCRPTATYNVWGACSDLKQKAADNVKNKKRRSGS